MQKRRKRNLKVRRSTAAWIEIMRAHQGSGLTVKAFCAAQGIGESTFWNWRKRVGPLPLTIAVKKPAQAFLPVAIVSPLPSSIEVCLGEMRVRLDGPAAAQVVEAIVERIGAGATP